MVTLPHMKRPEAVRTQQSEQLLQLKTKRSKAASAAVSISVDNAFANFNAAADELLQDASPGASSPLGTARGASEASYDFDEYIFLRNTLQPYMDPRAPGSTLEIPRDPLMARFAKEARAGLALFSDYAARNSTTTATLGQIQDRMQRLTDQLFAWWASVCSLRAFNTLTRYAGKNLGKPTREYFNLTPEAFYGYALSMALSNDRVAMDACKLYFSTDRNSDLAPIMKLDYWEPIVDKVFSDSFRHITVGETAPATEYPFDLFDEDEVLFGLQVVHRQDWRLLSHDRGELLKTIPLGPRESQKISVKLTRRTKRATSKEDSSSFETSSESSSTVKDSAEVVQEASEKSNKHAEAEVSGGYGPFVQASVSGGISQDLAASSRQTANRLNETMQKTASRMKRDTKVTVSTESEEGFEMSRSSELVNPNDEVAVTYLYHRLQSRYWVSTEVAEVHSVVFIPEFVPAPNQVDEAWIRRNAAVLKDALLDAAFGDLIDQIRLEPANVPVQTSSTFASAASAAVTLAQGYVNFKGGGATPDFLDSGQQYLERDLARRNELAAQAARRTHQTTALIEHLRQNILHYMRAIWRSEDYDQRMQRYARRRVPVAWSFVPYQSTGGTQVNPLQADGFFVPDISDIRPLTDVIDPIGPIGYLFNCAIYRLRDDVRLSNLHQALSYLRAAYTRFNVQVSISQGAGVTVRSAVVYKPISFALRLQLVRDAAANDWTLTVAPNNVRRFRAAADGSLDVFGIKVWLEGTAANGTQLTLDAQVTADIEDPHLRLLRYQVPLPPQNQEAVVFDAATLDSMRRLFPTVAAAVSAEAVFSGLDATAKQIVRDHYHEWLRIRDSGRQVSLDTGNVVLELEVSSSAALERFKRLHRYVDVMREYENVRRLKLDNDRRQALLDDHNYVDPDVEQVSVVTGVSGAAALMANLGK
jgi:hypothetical protein